MALVALTHLRDAMAGTTHRNEMFPVMTFRCLMALCAVFRRRRRVQVGGDAPGRRFVAPRAVPPQ